MSHSQLNDKLTQKSLRQKEVVILQGSMTDEVKRRKYCSLVDVSIKLTNVEIRPSIQQIKLSMLYQLIIFVIRLPTYRVRWKASGIPLNWYRVLSVCLSVSQFVCLSVCQSVHLSVCLSVCSSNCHLSVRLSVRLPVRRSVCVSVSMLVCKSVRLPVLWPVCLVSITQSYFR